ncbi:hypothetical protein [Lysobacter sp. A3-1-A15]|uniref:hypothetical protein n=1 Tax=Novilysobacter viscosus TaxID=3098602 RepID=UPI002ED91FF1
MAIVGSLLAACATVAPEPVAPAFDTAAAVRAVRAAGTVLDAELSVQPLRDPQVEDLRQDADALETRGMFQGAADALDRALAITPDDPALLQDRAEVALLLGDTSAAARLATRAYQLGSQVGPLCRRHWETLAQVRLATPSAADGMPASASVEQARERREACTVAPPPRF